MFSSMKISTIGRVVAVAALASTALSLVPQEAAAGFRFGGFGGGMRMGGFGGGVRMGGFGGMRTSSFGGMRMGGFGGVRTSSFGGGMRVGGFGGGVRMGGGTHVPGVFGGNRGFGKARTSQGFGERRFTQGGGFHGGFGGTRGMAKGGFGGRSISTGKFAGRGLSKGAGFGSRLTQRGGQHPPLFASNGGVKRAFSAHPVAARLGHGPTLGHVTHLTRTADLRQPRSLPFAQGKGTKGPVRQFGRLGPASVGFGLGLFQPVVDPDMVTPAVPEEVAVPVVAPVAPDEIAAPVVAPVAPEVVAAPIVAPVYDPIVTPTPVAAAPIGPVAVNPVPVAPAAPLRAFVATAPAAAPVAPVPGSPAACGVGSFVTVAFQANVTTADVKTFLEAYNVAIVAGPEADGTYRIQLSACPLTPDEVTQVVDSMRTQTAFVSKVDA